MSNLSHNNPRVFNFSAVHAPRDFAFITTDNEPICLEIGAGKGRHAILFAKNHPNQTLIAIERTKEKFLSFENQVLTINAQDNSLTNLQPIHADAIAWTVYGIFPKQIQTCFILYPNPEPHNKNQRFINMPFFEFLLSRMADGGNIIIASNIGEYIDEAADKLGSVWQLPYTRSVVPVTSNRTHFEAKYLSRGETCLELNITKPAGYITRFDDVLPKALSTSDMS